MKKLLITYRMNNKTENTENCFELSMLDNIADDLLDKGTESEFVNPTPNGYLYSLLQKISRLQGYPSFEFCTAEEIEN